MTTKPVPNPARPSRRPVKRIAAAVLLFGVALAGARFGHHYWTTGRFLQSTDDAYVRADFTIVAPKVSGYIADVLVRDNEHVKAGQLLARIDDRDFRVALAQARSDVAAADAAIRNLDAELSMQHSVVGQAQATVAATQASHDFAVVDAARYRQLIAEQAATVQRAQQTESLREQMAAQLRRDQAGAVAQHGKVAVLATARAQAVARLAHSRAVEQQAEINLSYTTITAPVDGTIGARALRVGQYVNAGTQLMAVVPLEGVYVVANFKETQLTDVRPGQPVDIEVDTFPGRTLRGHVDSLSPASGLEFALMPPDNATGNFTKIVQRIPVKILLERSELSGLLRAGMSVEPTIDTRGAATGAAPPAAARSNAEVAGLSGASERS